MDAAADRTPGAPDVGPAGGGSTGGVGSGKRRLAQLSTLAGLVIGGLTCAFVVNELASEWNRVRDAVADASPVWFAVGLVLCVLAMSSIGWVWTDTLALLGVRVDRFRALGWYYIGELGKYLPGGVWPVLGRGELARRGGVSGPRAYASVALSLVTLYLAAMMVAVGLLPFAFGGDGPGAAAVVLVLLPLGLGALHPRVLDPLLRLVRRVTKRPLAVAVPPWRDTALVVVRYVPTWIFIGGATAAVAHAVEPNASVPRLMFAAVLSWIVGFLAVPVPAGAGVREAVFIAASGLDDGLGATVAVATRVLFILVDGGGAALAAPLLRRARPRVAPDGETATGDGATGDARAGAGEVRAGDVRAGPAPGDIDAGGGVAGRAPGGSPRGEVIPEV